MLEQQQALVARLWDLHTKVKEFQGDREKKVSGGWREGERKGRGGEERREGGGEGGRGWGSTVHKRGREELREGEGKWRGRSDEGNGKGGEWRDEGRGKGKGRGGRRALSQQLTFLLPT